MDPVALRIHDMWTVFAIFLSLLMIPKMRMVIELTKLNWKYSIKRIFIVLEKLHKIKDENGDLKELERTKIPEDLPNLLNSVSW
ncbi:MAG: hypothetical protein ACYCSG_02845 [Thermoplasmataceae archaeon]